MVPAFQIEMYNLVLAETLKDQSLKIHNIRQVHSIKIK